jgi:mannose-6-phosphate isomerase
VREGRVEALMGSLSVAPGDVVFVPAGTLHAINAGIVLFEIQQKSDLTYRVYDYGRLDAKTGQPRELHLERSLDVSSFVPAPNGKVAPLSLAPGRELLIACPYFALERLAVGNDWCAAPDPGSFEILTVIEGEGSLGTAEESLPLRRGDSVVLPATLGDWRLDRNNAGPELAVLRVYVPDLATLAAEARAAGHSEARAAEVIRP